jgi:hypothetical protein
MCAYVFGRVGVVIGDGESRAAGPTVGQFMRLMKLWV